MTVNKSKVEKLEEAMFGKLSPKDRAYWALKETAAGNKEGADRIALACPRVKYTSADLAFTNRVDDLLDLARGAASLVVVHRQACQTVERQMDSLPPAWAELMGKIVSAGVGLIESQEKATISLRDAFEDAVRETSAARMTALLNAWRQGLLHRFRAEWAGFDAFCREETGLDARTLIVAADKMFYHPPSDLLEWLDAALAEDIREDDSDGKMRQVQEEVLALGRKAWARARGGEEPDNEPDGAAQKT
jgi:hypothetical protein